MLRINKNELASQASCEPAESITLEDRSASASVLPLDDTEEDPALTPFLDEIIDRLSSLPAAMRPDIRRELRSHLEARIAAFEERGMRRADAAATAIGQFGQPSALARRFRHSYESTLPRTIPWTSIRLTLGVFGAALLLYAALLTLSSACPQSQVLSQLLTMMFWLFPLFAGGGIGRHAPRRAALGVFYGFAAFATLLLPLFFYLAYSNFGVTESDASASILAQDVLKVLLPWPLIGTLSAALSSRIDWKTRNPIEFLPAFAARALSLSLGSLLASGMMLAAWNDLFRTQAAHLASPSQLGFAQVCFQCVSIPIQIVLFHGVPAMLGRRIGKAWPRPEMWRRKTLPYVITAAAASPMSVSLVTTATRIAMLLQSRPSPIHGVRSFSSLSLDGHLSLSFAGYFLDAVRGIAFVSAPLAVAAVLIAADRKRGGDRRLLFGAALAALAYIALDEKVAWFYGTTFARLHHLPAHLPLYVTLMPYAAPILCGVLIAAAWRRLPRGGHAGDA